MEQKHVCPNCGKPVGQDAPSGICPECLIQAGFPTGTSPESAAGGKPRFSAPPVDGIRPLFPLLEIAELLGWGGMGAVYKARQPLLNRWVALKILAQGRDEDVQFAERFQREARALARMNHPNIVTVYEFGETAGRFYLLMEYVDGLNLRQLELTRRLTPEEALAIVPPICEALQYAHQHGIVHRDIKPENILLDTAGRVKITDFGIAKIVGAEEGDERPLTGNLHALGTPHYMAPEQIEKPATVDRRADIYSLGVVFYEMLTGELPLGRFAPPSKKARIDVRLDEVVMRALEKEPELRYQQASDVRTQVEAITSAPSPSPELPDRQAPVAKPNPAAADAPGGGFAMPWQIWVGLLTVVMLSPLGFGEAAILIGAAALIHRYAARKFAARGPGSDDVSAPRTSWPVRLEIALIVASGLADLFLVAPRLPAVALLALLARGSLVAGLLFRWPGKLAAVSWLALTASICLLIYESGGTKSMAVPLQWGILNLVLAWLLGTSFLRRYRTLRRDNFLIDAKTPRAAVAAAAGFAALGLAIWFAIPRETIVRSQVRWDDRGNPVVTHHLEIWGDPDSGSVAYALEGRLYSDRSEVTARIEELMKENPFTFVQFHLGPSTWERSERNNALDQLIEPLKKTGFFGMEFKYDLEKPPVAGIVRPVPNAARSPFPKAAHIGGTDKSVLVVHDDAELHYALYYPGDFNTSTRGSHNRQGMTWRDDGTVTLRRNGRTFGYLRESPDELRLRINGREFDLRAGRVLLLKDDGLVEQLPLFPPLDAARDREELRRLVAGAQARPAVQDDDPTSAPAS